MCHLSQSAPLLQIQQVIQTKHLRKTKKISTLLIWAGAVMMTVTMKIMLPVTLLFLMKQWRLEQLLLLLQNLDARKETTEAAKRDLLQWIDFATQATALSYTGCQKRKGGFKKRISKQILPGLLWKWKSYIRFEKTSSLTTKRFDLAICIQEISDKIFSIKHKLYYCTKPIAILLDALAPSNRWILTSAAHGNGCLKLPRMRKVLDSSL